MGHQLPEPRLLGTLSVYFRTVDQISPHHTCPKSSLGEERSPQIGSYPQVSKKLSTPARLPAVLLPNRERRKSPPSVMTASHELGELITDAKGSYVH